MPQTEQTQEDILGSLRVNFANDAECIAFLNSLDPFPEPSGRTYDQRAFHIYFFGDDASPYSDKLVMLILSKCSPLVERYHTEYGPLPFAHRNELPEARLAYVVTHLRKYEFYHREDLSSQAALCKAVLLQEGSLDKLKEIYTTLCSDQTNWRQKCYALFCCVDASRRLLAADDARSFMKTLYYSARGGHVAAGEFCRQFFGDLTYLKDAIDELKADQAKPSLSV